MIECRFIQQFRDESPTICHWDSGGQSAPAQQSTTQTQVSAPPAYLAPYLNEAAGQAHGIYFDRQPQYFNQSTLAPQSGATTGAIDRTITRATNGSPLLPAAQGVNLATLQGQYLSPDSNPFARATVDAANRPLVENYQNVVAPGNDSRFSLAGRYGSGAHVAADTQGQEALQRQMSDNSNAIYSGIYNTERGYQNQAVAAAPGLAQADYQDIAALQGAGQAQDAYRQAQIDAEKQRFDYNQNLPWANLNQYAGLLAGQNRGGVNTSTSSGSSTYPLTGNSFLSGVGQATSTAASLAQLARLFGAFGGK